MFGGETHGKGIRDRWTYEMYPKGSSSVKKMLESCFDGDLCVQWREGEQGIAVHRFPLFPVTQELGTASAVCLRQKKKKRKHFSNTTQNLRV